MIELLILYELNKKTLTMYGISKEISSAFSVLMTPSFGTIKPALLRLERKDFIKKNKVLSEGGRPSVYYSVTPGGIKELTNLLLEDLPENPIKFLVSARIKIACASVLNTENQQHLLKTIKTRAEKFLVDTNCLLQKESQDFYLKMTYENMVCEYKNFISLIEGLEHGCKD